ncbi:uncharacterized protein [Atheta coriaria]|uniref:uncharacterized protein n=1 Tax=Dalotia coriaria TaxID=877792 RepID=UPI0031F4578E
MDWNMDNLLRDNQERTVLVNSAPNICPRINSWLPEVASVLSVFQRLSCTAGKKGLIFDGFGDFAPESDIVEGPFWYENIRLIFDGFWDFAPDSDIVEGPFLYQIILHLSSTHHRRLTILVSDYKY